MPAGRVTVGFPRMHKEASERRDFLPPLIGLLAANGAEVYLRDRHRVRDGLQRHRLQHRVAQRAHHRRGGVLPPGHRGGPAGAGGPLRAAPTGARCSCRCSTSRPGRRAWPCCASSASTRVSLDLIANDDGPAAGREPAQRRLERRRVGVRRAGADVAEPAEPAPVHGQGHDPGGRAGRPARRGVRDEVRRRRPQRGLRPDRAARRGGRHGGPQPHRGCRLPEGPAGRSRTSSWMRRRGATRPCPSCRTRGSPSCRTMPSSATWRWTRTCSTRRRRSCAASRASRRANLDQWEFAPDDPAWDALPPGIPTDERRTVVSCYSWPGVRPEPCMHVYGSQLAPLLELLVSAGGVDGIRPEGSYFEQAVARGSLRYWQDRAGSTVPAAPGGAGD